MRNILLLTPTAAPGGAERALLGLATHARTFGFEPLCVSLEHGPIEQWFADAGHSMTVIPTGRTRYLAGPARSLVRLRRFIRDHDIAVVVSNQSKGHVYGGLAAKLAGVPAVWWQQGIPERGRIDRVAARIPAAAVVCSSEDAVNAQRAQTPHLEIRKVHLGSPIDEIAAHKGRGLAIRRQLGWDDKTIVGIVGRLQPWKGQQTFLEAAALVAKDFPNARFAIVGGAILGWEGDYPRQLERYADANLTGLTHFSGHQEDVYAWFDALDIAVHASFAEPFGLVLIEAMALGKPLIAAAEAGPLEIVEDGVSAILVPPGDAELLAHAMGRVLGDPQLAGDLARNGETRAHVFSDEKMAERYAEVLEEVLSP